MFKHEGEIEASKIEAEYFRRVSLWMEIFQGPYPGTQAISHQISSKLDLIISQNHKIMADLKQAFTDVITRIGTAMQTISDDIKAVADKIKGSGLSAADESDILASLTGVAAKAEAIADEANSVVNPPADGGTGSTPPADGSTPPADGSTPPADGSIPPVDGSTPSPADAPATT